MRFTRRSLIVLIAALLLLGVFVLREPRDATDMNAPFFDAVAHLRDAKSMGLNAAIEAEVDLVPLDPELPDDGDPFYVPVVARGDLTMSHAEDAPFTMRAHWQIEDRFGTDLILGLETLLDAFGGLYLRIGGLPSTEAGLAKGVDVSELNGKWFTMSPEIIASAIPKLDSAHGEAVMQPRRADGIKAALASVVSTSSLERYEDTRIDGARHAHYALRPSSDAVAKVFAALAETAAGRALAPSEQSAIHDAALKKTVIVDAFVDLVDDRFTIVNIVLLPASDSDEGRPLSATLRFGEMDVTVDASTPEDAVPFETLLLSLVPAGLVE